MLALQGAQLQLTVGAEEAILMDGKTGKVLFEKNAQKPAYPASTTKIATALLLLNRYRDCLGNLYTAERDSLISISPEAKKQSNYKSPSHWIETGSTHIGLKRGEQLSLYDLLHGLMLASGNDAANVIAQSLGGTIPQYMEQVNAYVKSIGCLNTHYNNPHGLHHPEHVTTAYDLALMAKKGLEDPIFRSVVGTPRYTCLQTNLQEERTLVQGNLLLRSGSHFYPKAIGVKTGYTQAAGKNLVAAAQSGDRELIAVVLGYRGPRAELYNDVQSMFEAAFNEQKLCRTVLQKGEQKLTTTVRGASERLKTYLSENLTYDFYPSGEMAVKMGVSWKIPPLPVAQNSPVGCIRVFDGQGNVLKETTLFASNALNPTVRFQIQSFFAQYWKLSLMAMLSSLFLLGIVMRQRRRAH